MKSFTSGLLCVCILFTSVKTNAQNISGGNPKIPYTSGGQQIPNPLVYINLLLPVNGNPILLDGVAEVYAPGYSKNVDDNDATKMSNFTENIALMRDGKKLAIETRPFPKYTDTMYIRMWQMKQQTYTVQTSPQYIPKSVKIAWLIDNLMHTKTKLDLENISNYNFTVTSDTTTYINRFMIVFMAETYLVKDMVDQKKSTGQPLVNPGKVDVFPNPVSGMQATLQFTDMEKGIYTANVCNRNGNVVNMFKIDHQGGTTNHTISFKLNQQPGLYNIVLVNQKTGLKNNIPLIITK